jgi:hypothetical protein
MEEGDGVATCLEDRRAKHKIRMGQVRRVRKGDIRVQNRFIDQVVGLAA